MAVDDVEFDRSHWMSPSVVGYWCALGNVPKDMLGTLSDMTPTNSGTATTTPNGLAWGNTSGTTSYASIVQSTAWKPTAATTIIGLFAAPAAGISGTYLFRTENTVDGWGCYNATTSTPHMYMRIGSAWADVGVSGGALGREPTLVGMSYDGSTFTARWGTNKATAAASGSIVQSAIDATFPSCALMQQFIVLDRALSDAEWAALLDAPYQMLRVRPQNVLAFESASYNLSAEGVSRTYSLGAAALTRGYSFSASGVDRQYSFGAASLNWQPAQSSDTHDGFRRRSRRERALDAAAERERQEWIAERNALRLSLEAAMGYAAEVVEDAPPAAVEAVEAAQEAVAVVAPVLSRRVVDGAALVEAQALVARLHAAIEEAARMKALAEDDEEVLMLLRAL